MKTSLIHASVHSFTWYFWSLIMFRAKGFPGGAEVKASACNVGDLGSIPGLGRSLGEGNGNPLQYSCLENPMDGGAWWAIVHGLQRVRHDWATSLFTSDWITITFSGLLYKIYLTHKSSLNLALAYEMRIQLVPLPQITRVIWISSLLGFISKTNPG